MIAVIADDLTGAAELGAVGLRYGLSAEVQGGRRLDSPAELVILNSDSRSLPVDRAARAAADAARDVQAAAGWVYKKVDSVLRGPVVAEIEAVLPALGMDRALLVPANPSMGRTICGGHYFIGGQPLHRTGFAADKEYPAATSDVLGLLGPAGSVAVSVLAQGQPLPSTGIAVGEASCPADLAGWAEKVDDRTLPVGGAEFFAAVLEARGYRVTPQAPAPVVPAGARLLVCGSSPPYAVRTVQQARARGVAMLPMPEEVVAAESHDQAAISRWAQAACEAMNSRGMAVVSIGTGEDRQGTPSVLVDRLADVAVAVMGTCAVAHLCVEGGATAWALVQRLGWRRLTLFAEPAPGVASLKPADREGPVLTMKPGSYPWPEEVWPRGR